MDEEQPDLLALARIHNLILGRKVSQTDSEIKELANLWQALVQEDLDPAQAWAGVVSVVLRDPRFIHY